MRFGVAFLGHAPRPGPPAWIGAHRFASEAGVIRGAETRRPDPSSASRIARLPCRCLRFSRNNSSSRAISSSRISLIFAALFVPLGIHLPYFPLWLEAKGFGAEEIAHHPCGADVPARHDHAAAHRLADRAKGPRQCADCRLSLRRWSSRSAISCRPIYAIVLLVSLALQIVWSPHSPLADSLALSGVRRFGSNYPAMRIWGSIAFLIANFAGGAILACHERRCRAMMITIGLARNARRRRCLRRASASRGGPPRCRPPICRIRRRNY